MPRMYATHSLPSTRSTTYKHITEYVIIFRNIMCQKRRRIQVGPMGKVKDTQKNELNLVSRHLFDKFTRCFKRIIRKPHWCIFLLKQSNRKDRKTCPNFSTTYPISAVNNFRTFKCAVKVSRYFLLVADA